MPFQARIEQKYHSELSPQYNTQNVVYSVVLQAKMIFLRWLFCKLKKKKKWKEQTSCHFTILSLHSSDKTHHERKLFLTHAQFWAATIFSSSLSFGNQKVLAFGMILLVWFYSKHIGFLGLNGEYNFWGSQNVLYRWTQHMEPFLSK